MKVRTLESDSTHCVDLESMQNQEPKNKIERAQRILEGMTRKDFDFLNFVPERKKPINYGRRFLQPGDDHFGEFSVAVSLHLHPNHNIPN